MAQTAKVSTFGFNATDSSEAFYHAMQSDNDTLIIDRQSGPWILGPMRFSKINNKVILIEKGVEIRAKEKAFPNTSDALLKFLDCSNIKILGNGNKLCMKKSEYTEGEWRHGISIRSCNDIILKNFEIHDSGGDGIYISGTKSGNFSKNIYISNIVATNNKRQGMSIISAQNVQVKNCIFQNSIGTLPGAGVDLEPNNKNDRLENITFSKCIFQNNDHAGVVLALRKLESDSRPVNIRFTNCFIQNNHNKSNKYIASEIVFSAHKTKPVRGNVVFENCVVKNSRWGLFYSRKTNDAYTVTFRNCSAIDICGDESYPAIYLEVPDYHEGSYSLGGYTFDNLFISYATNVPLFQVRGSQLNTLTQLSDITGKIFLGKKTPNTFKYIKYNAENNKRVDLDVSYTVTNND